jgi:hypothetical protein
VVLNGGADAVPDQSQHWSLTMHKLITHNKYLFSLAVLLALALASGAGFKWG